MLWRRQRTLHSVLRLSGTRELPDGVVDYADSYPQIGLFTQRDVILGRSPPDWYCGSSSHKASTDHVSHVTHGALTQRSFCSWSRGLTACTATLYLHICLLYMGLWNVPKFRPQTPRTPCCPARAHAVLSAAFTGAPSQLRSHACRVGASM